MVRTPREQDCMSNKNFRRDRSHKGFRDNDEHQGDGGFFPPQFMRQPGDRPYGAYGGDRPQYDDRPRRSFGSDAAPGVEADVTVKWFDPNKGFGFVALSDGSGDAFLHVRQVEAAGFSSVEPGTPLKVVLGSGQKGQQVNSIIEVGEAPAQPAYSAPRPRTAPRFEQASGPSEVKSGAVKWYDATKGFGFVQVDGGGRDIFVHASALRRSGLETLLDGQRVEMEVVTGKKGLEASRVTVL